MADYMKYHYKMKHNYDKKAMYHDTDGKWIHPLLLSRKVS